MIKIRNTFLPQLAAIASLVLMCSPAHAANIIWVTASRDGVVPTAWSTVLSGHTVTGFTGGTTPNAAQIATLNAADLVIFDGSNGSTSAGTASVWNGLSVPLISMGAYSTDNWGWMTGSGGAAGGTTTPTVLVDSDPIWSGVADSDPGTPGLQLANFYDNGGARWALQIVAGKGGTVLADVGSSNVAIVRWGTGAFATGGGGGNLRISHDILPVFTASLHCQSSLPTSLKLRRPEKLRLAGRSSHRLL